MRKELAIGPRASPMLWKLMKRPEQMFSTASMSYLSDSSGSYSMDSSISGITGIEIIPAESPIIQRPKKMKTGYFWNSNSWSDPPIISIATVIMMKPIRIMPLFLILWVNRYMKGHVQA